MFSQGSAQKSPKDSSSVQAFQYQYSTVSECTYPTVYGAPRRVMLKGSISEIFIPSRNLVFNQHNVFRCTEARETNVPLIEIQLSKGFVDKLDAHIKREDALKQMRDDMSRLQEEIKQLEAKLNANINSLKNEIEYIGAVQTKASTTFRP